MRSHYLFRTLFARGAIVFGDVFSECLYDGVGESHLVVYAVVGHRLLQRLGNDYGCAVVFALVVFCSHVLQQEAA